MSKPDNINTLYENVKNLIIEARTSVARTVNYVTLVHNWEIGRLIVEEEQGGKSKAEYGKYIIKELAQKLTKEFGSGYNEQNLRFFRQFYITFPIRYALRSKSEFAENKEIGIGDALRDQLDNKEKVNALHSQSESVDKKENTIRYALSSKSATEIRNALRSKSHPLFTVISPQLSWTHYRSLLRVKDPKAREFYMREAVANGWSTRALDRQINSLYYERLLASQNKQPVIDEMKQKTDSFEPQDILKDPYILEFLQLKDNSSFRESELEQALIDKLTEFLLELGKGFAFVARQKHIKTETKDFYIDLVFYNYLLKCFVLIDLKTSELTHQDIGQMDMYVRLYEEKYKAPDDNPTIGLILATYKDETIVKYSILNESKQIFASKYKLYLPDEEELRKEIERQKLQFELETKHNKNL